MVAPMGQKVTRRAVGWERNDISRIHDTASDIKTSGTSEEHDIRYREQELQDRGIAGGSLVL